ncbi:hypothetical protein EHQ46_11260 [Leptospira yanagawae]|uniref:DUF2029 domain-containing protein n=1 Tax=Leptospira yanagawae TaxID=293069 RepID=A0ABY2M3M3_9LEPT|nr:hypothetical protein [Leptospira yanagawae]TGL19964.1 hypothetical protein EHQ46_11260 [Leptospira yanagawae]
MNHSKKAIGFFFIFGFFILCYFLTKLDSIKSFSDFSLFEWQTLLVTQGKFHLPYAFSHTDPNYRFFPIPDLFFHLTNNVSYSTFPNLYSIFVAPMYFLFGTRGIQLTQFLMFITSVWLFYLITKNEVLAFLLLFGSSIFLYIFLIHDTIFVFFLEVVTFYFYAKKYYRLSALLSVLIIWLRPELGIVFCFLPFLFPNTNRWKQYLITCSLFLILASIVNFGFYETFLPIRMIKNKDSIGNWEVGYYLLRLVLEQIPLFILLLLFLIWEWIRKKKNALSVLITFATIFICFVSPNTGGHDTPRYLYGFIPVYLLSIHLRYENQNLPNKLIYLLITFFLFYSTYQINNQLKTLSKISKYQTNLLSAMETIKPKTIVFDNSDLSFIALPLLEKNKNIFLLREDGSQSGFSNFLVKNQIDEFVFLELPPSPYPLPNSLSIQNCIKNCEYRKVDTHSLPHANLPITYSHFLRSFD